MLLFYLKIQIENIEKKNRFIYKVFLKSYGLNLKKIKLIQNTKK